MKRVVFNFVFQGCNIGDLAASPLSYYDIPYSQIIPGEFTQQAKLFNNALFLYGGGGLLCLRAHFQELRKRDNKLATWGIGFNYHGSDWKRVPHDTSLLEAFDLVGLRDFTDLSQVHENAFHTPCVSCKHPAFDQVYTVEDPIRVYQHYEIPIPDFTDCPRRTNHTDDGPFPEVIRFIGGCQTLITNSFHGAYWGALLGKKVYIYRPFSSKFKDLPYGVVIRNESEMESLEPLSAGPSFLQRCREKNDQFYRVFNIFRATCG